MDLLVSIACRVLKIIAIGITLLNELTLFAVPWICAPSAASVPAPPFPHPLLTSVTYAVVEPLYVVLLAKSGFEPWIHVFNTPQHLLISYLALEYLSFLGRSQTWLQSLRPPVTDQIVCKSSTDVDPELQPALRDGNSIWRPKVQACIVAFFLTNSVAASNAAFLLFTADLESQLSGDSVDLMLFMGSLAVVFYLISRYMDLQITQHVNKPPLWRRQPNTTLKMHLGFLAVMLLVKIAGRHVLHHSHFPIFQIVSSREVMPPLAEQMSPWLAAVMGWKALWPKWVTTLWKWGSTPVQIYAFYVFRKSLEKILAEESPRAERAEEVLESNIDIKLSRQ